MFEELILAAVGLIILLIVLVVFAGGIYIVRQWENVAVLRFGKIVKTAKEPGIHYKIPLIDSIRRVDFRMRTLDLRGQKAITKDNISVGIDAVVFLRVEDAERVIVNVVDYEEAVSKYAQTSIRDIIGQYTLDELLANREQVAKSLKNIVDELSAEWGVDITKAELQEIFLPDDMKRAFAVQAESERESRAIIIKANAELQASETLKKAALNLSDPNAMQLRILETIKQVSKDQSNTILLALPLETIQAVGIQGLSGMAAIRPKFTQGDLQKTKQTSSKTED
jgi:regulator of protease activity HflC (stomatin/prohibitin superfamily)